MSVLAPTSSAEPPQTLAARNFRPGNRPRHRRHLLCCRQSIPRTHGAASRRRTGTGLGPTTATPPHRSIQLLRGIQLFAASSFGPRRQHRSIRLSAGVQLFRGAQLCAAPPHQQHRSRQFFDNQTSNHRFPVNRNALRRSPIYRQTGRFPASAPNRQNRRFPALAPNPPKPPIPRFSPKSAKTTDSQLCHRIGQNRRFRAFQLKQVCDVGTTGPCRSGRSSRSCAALRRPQPSRFRRTGLPNKTPPLRLYLRNLRCSRTSR